MNATSRPDDRSGSHHIVQTVPLPGANRSGHEVGVDDWLDALLTEGSRPSKVGADDPAFVAQVIARLAVESSPTRYGEEFSVMRWSHHLLLGFVALVATALSLAAPSALQAWLLIAQQPWPASVWSHPDLWGFMAGVAMLVFGGLELVRAFEASEADQVPGAF